MSLELYPYQIETINQLRAGFMDHQRQIMCLATGGGKTVVFSTIAEAAVKKGTKTLIITDRLELFKQTVESIESFGIPVCKINGDSKRIVDSATMFVGMCETIKRRLPQLIHIPFQLIIADECHAKAFNKIFDAWPTTKVIGATASPIGDHLHKYYTNLVQCIDTPDLIKQGFLCDYKAFEKQDDLSDIKIKSNGEFEDESMFKHYDKAKLYGDVIEDWLSKCKGQKTICFCVNVAHTIKMTAAFNAAGIKAYCIHSKTPDDERKWILEEYSRGGFPVLVNANILTKGYNEKDITCVILNRATTSLALFLQMIGRGSRTFPGKKFFTCLDVGGNHSRLGMWNEPRLFELNPPKKKRNTLGAAPVKTCKACTAMLSMSTKECPYCGYLFPIPEEVLKRGIMVELTNNIRASIPGKYLSQCTIPELIELETVKQINAKHVWRIMRHRGAMSIGEYARIKKYKDQWIINQLETLEFELREGGVTFADKKINEIEFLTL